MKKKLIFSVFLAAVTMTEAQDKLYHDGIELEKGVVITPSFLERNEDLMAESV